MGKIQVRVSHTDKSTNSVFFVKISISGPDPGVQRPVLQYLGI